MVEQVRPEIDQPKPRWAQAVAGIAAPTLVIAGGAASPVSQEHGADLAAALPDAHQVTIEADHLVHAREPEAFIRAVRDFLDAGAAIPADAPPG